MAGKSVSFNTHCNLYESHLETVAKWLSCNGEVWGVGPTAVFASAAALFLYNELEATVFIPGDHGQVSLLEKTLVSTMLLGMLALMIHIWVCSMRFFQYYLDTLIKDSPSIFLEMTTAGLLGGKSDIMPLGALSRFLRQQQPQIHITMCWFLSLCYADYVRKHYCTRFNMPYLEQWQAELHERAARGVNQTMEKVNSFVASVHNRLRGYSAPLRNNETHTVRVHPPRDPPWRSAVLPARCPGLRGAGESAASSPEGPPRARARSCVCVSSASRAKRLLTLLKNSGIILRQQGVRAVVHRTPASVVLALPLLRKQTFDDCPWRNMAQLPFK